MAFLCALRAQAVSFRDIDVLCRRLLLLLINETPVQYSQLMMQLYEYP